MSETETTYNRMDHTAACPCDQCIHFDADMIRAHLPNNGIGWKPNGLESLLSAVRNRELNWSLESGHCAYCGGIELNVSKLSEHELVKHHNVKQVDGLVYTSLLVADGSGWLATARSFAMQTRHLWTGKPCDGKTMLRDWVAHMLGIPLVQATAIATRKLEGWTEFRLGFRPQ